MNINLMISELDNWNYEDNKISKLFKFDSYMDGIKLVDKVALEAEKAEHHPDITIGYKEVTITLTTHDTGTVTEKDINLAKQIDSIYNG